MDAETVRLLQRILFGDKLEPIPTRVVDLYKKIKFRMDKLSGGIVMTAFELVLLCEMEGVLPEPVEAEDIPRSLEPVTEPEPEPEPEVETVEPKTAEPPKKRRGRPPGSGKKKLAIRREEAPEPAEAVVAAVE